MKKCVIYARYSSDSQTEQSIEGQLRVCEDYAKNHHIQVVKNYVDRAMTGTNDNRPDFREMLTDAQKREWDIVLVYRFDRFSRNKYESVIHKKKLKDLGIKVVSAMENIPDTPEGIILESLLEGMNQYYSAELSLKVKRGQRESRLKGNFLGGKVPYGYRVENQKLIINEEEAKIIRYIYKEFAKEELGCNIAKKLNRKKILYRNRLFRRSDIYRLLGREYYTGLYEFDGEYYQKIFPQIISRNLFAKIRRIALDNKHGANRKTMYMLKNMIFCKNCGEVYVCDSGTSKIGNLNRYYKCKNRKVYKTCNSISFVKELVEDFIYSYLTSFISNEENLKNIVSILMKKLKKRQKDNFLDSLLLEKKNNEILLENYMKALEDGLYSEKLKENIEKAEGFIRDIEHKIVVEKYRDMPEMNKPFVKKYYLKSIENKPRAFARALILKILVDEKSMDIYLENPYCDRHENFILIKKERLTSLKILSGKEHFWSGEVSIFL